MDKAVKTDICPHCRKNLRDTVKIIGLACICPYCGRPCEKVV